MCLVIRFIRLVCYNHATVHAHALNAYASYRFIIWTYTIRRFAEILVSSFRLSLFLPSVFIERFGVCFLNHNPTRNSLQADRNSFWHNNITCILFTLTRFTRVALSLAHSVFVGWLLISCLFSQSFFSFFFTLDAIDFATLHLHTCKRREHLLWFYSISFFFSAIFFISYWFKSFALFLSQLKGASLRRHYKSVHLFTMCILWCE